MGIVLLNVAVVLDIQVVIRHIHCSRIQKRVTGKNEASHTIEGIQLLMFYLYCFQNRLHYINSLQNRERQILGKALCNHLGFQVLRPTSFIYPVASGTYRKPWLHESIREL